MQYQRQGVQPADRRKVEEVESKQKPGEGWVLMDLIMYLIIAV
jgi:hypothetical protein